MYMYLVNKLSLSLSSQRKFKSTADVLESVLADSASEDGNSMDSSSEGDDLHSQSSAESSVGDNVGDSSSSRKRSRVRRTNKATVVDGGWTDNNAQDAADPLPFTGDSGCVEPVQSEDPLDFFEQFVTSDFVSDCVRETNRYASGRRNEANPSPFSRMRSWVETTVYELFLYFTVLILMGVDRRPKLSMYWSQDFLLNTPAFSTLMSRDRFLLIRRFLHFVNNSDYERGVSGKLFKIKPVLEYFQKKFKSLFNPGKFFAVDESLLLWKGRLGWKQYIPKK